MMPSGYGLSHGELELPTPKCTSASCDYVFWNNPTPVAAIVELDDAIVLVRNKGWPEKMYWLITGFLEKGETPAGILREIREELGLEGKAVNFIGYYSFFEMNQLILAFHVQARGKRLLAKSLPKSRPLIRINSAPGISVQGMR